MEPFFFIFTNMTHSLHRRAYENAVLTLKGQSFKTINGKIYEVNSDTLNTFGCRIDIVIQETEVGPDIISRFMTELSDIFQPLCEKYNDPHGTAMKNTVMMIRKLMFTGGPEDPNLGYNINDTMSTVLPMEKLQWTKDLHKVKDVIEYTRNPEVLQLMVLDETTTEKLNRILKQLQSQKNVPHNLQIHLDFIEEGTIRMNDVVEAYYKLPEGIELKCSVDLRNHNKITGSVNFKYKPIYVEYPTSPENGKIMRETIVNLLSGKFKQLFELNGLIPENFASSSSNSFERALFSFNIKWTG